MCELLRIKPNQPRPRKGHYWPFFDLSSFADMRLEPLEILFTSPVTRKESAEAKSWWDAEKHILKLGYREVVQGVYFQTSDTGFKRPSGAFCGIPFYGWIEYLGFKRVSKHIDDMFEHGLHVYFVHKVVWGKCSIKTYKGTVHLKKGDVFYLNPWASHEVTSNTPCVTKTITTTAHDLRQSKKVLLHASTTKTNHCQ